MLVHDRPGCHQNDGFRGTIPTISYTGFSVRSDPRIVGCGGSQTTRIADGAGRIVGSNRGLAATYTEQNFGGRRRSCRRLKTRNRNVSLLRKADIDGDT